MYIQYMPKIIDYILHIYLIINFLPFLVQTLIFQIIVFYCLLHSPPMVSMWGLGPGCSQGY